MENQLPQFFCVDNVMAFMENNCVTLVGKLLTLPDWKTTTAKHYFLWKHKNLQNNTFIVNLERGKGAILQKKKKKIKHYDHNNLLKVVSPEILRE